MVKVTIEISDENADYVSKELKMDLALFIEGITKQSIETMKQLVLMAKADIPISKENLREKILTQSEKIAKESHLK